MNATSVALILTGVALNATAQLLLKAGAIAAGPIELEMSSLSGLRALLLSGWVLSGLACYAVSVLAWILALSRVEVSVAYPMLSLGYVATAVAGWMLYDETITPLRVAAIGVIIVGVCMLAVSARTT